MSVGARIFACVSVLILLAGAGTAFAQGAQGNGTLTGTVVDNVGVVPGATVTATQVDTNVARSTTTNEQGEFRIPSLPPGRYTLKVEMDGFKPINMPAFPLLGNETRPLGRLTLSAGGVSESVTITAEVTPVQTATSALTKNITSDTLVSVQVKGRDIFGMMKILPGVVDTTNSRDFAQWSSGRGLSINGGNSLNKNTTIDGVPVGEESGDGTTHITPNIDAIGEVNVITSGYTAENGRQSSGLISIVTKSGTNQYRGSGWYNARRDEWNKNDFFRIKNKDPKPFFEVNITGYSFGGPVIIPGLLDSRTNAKKTYFFISQEFTKDIRPTSVSRTNLPTQLERNGDFSQTILTTGASTASANGIFQTIIDPETRTSANPAGTAFDGMKIPSNRFNPMGQAMLYLLPMPNNIFSTVQADRFSSNDARDTLPEHIRSNFVLRIDQVINQNVRASGKLLFDRDHSTTFNRVAPGVGSVNNLFPGDLVTGALSQVIGPTTVNEVTVGFSHNHWGFIVGTNPKNLNAEDYTQFYRQNTVNPVTGQLGLDPPRLEPFGAFNDPPQLSRDHKDEYPYMPEMTFSGGERSLFGSWRPSGGNGPLPRWNENFRYTLQDDLSVTKGRHNFKFGFFMERDSKTEPGSVGYAGQYNFGHSDDDPITNNGFANALLGRFTSYTEVNDRVDAERRHWQMDGYAQDSWRINSRMTLDYGVRLTHSGTVYEVRDQNSGFDPALWSSSNAPTLFQPICLSGAAGSSSCNAANRRAFNPVSGQTVAFAYQGTTVPGVGSVTNGMWRNGLAHHPTNPIDSKDGVYYHFPAVSVGPRVGFAWDLFGDGKTALRASGGIFYNFPNTNQYLYTGGALVSVSRTIRNESIDSISAIAASGVPFSSSPQTGNLPQGALTADMLRGKQLPQGNLEPEKNYQANVAFQRDIGFNTVAEVAWVTNIGRKFWRTKTANNIPVFAYGNVNNQFNASNKNDNFLREQFPGTGSLRYLATDDDILNYNAMQVSVQRRLSRGLQMGVAYTLAKGEGIQGWDFATEELGGKEGIRERYYGPPSATQNQDRRHIAVINYSYAIPTPFKSVKVLAAALGNWEASGVTQFTSGEAVTPSCGGSSLSGTWANDPTLTGVTLRCDLTGQPLNGGFDVDTALPEEDRPHFNAAALTRPTIANNSTVGVFGNSGPGILRNPGWQNWDFTLARRVPVNIGRGGSVRIQIQFYNLFNMVEFREMAVGQSFNSSGVNQTTNTGKYTSTTNPFNGGVTVRFDY